MFVYAGLFGTGSLIYGRIAQAIVWVVAFVVSGVVLMRVVRRIWSAERAGSPAARLQRSPRTARAPRRSFSPRGLGTRMREPTTNDVARAGTGSGRRLPGRRQ